MLTIIMLCFIGPLCFSIFSFFILLYDYKIHTLELHFVMGKRKRINVYYVTIHNFHSSVLGTDVTKTLLSLLKLKQDSTWQIKELKCWTNFINLWKLQDYISKVSKCCHLEVFRVPNNIELYITNQAELKCWTDFIYLCKL